MELKELKIICTGTQLAKYVAEHQSSFETIAIKDIYNPEDIQREYIILYSTGG